MVGYKPKWSILKPTIQQPNKKDIFGFDIETYGRKNKFYCASVWHKKPSYCKTFFTKDECIEYFKKKRFRNSLICATNLQFDFFGVFYDDTEVNNFVTLFRGSHLLFCKTYLKNGSFNRKYKRGSYALTFIDSLNYAGLSVEKLAKLIGIEKMKVPSFIGKKPSAQEEIDYMIKYNMRDSEVSARALEFLFDSFYKLGATPKITIASTSMSLFKNKYLKHDYFRNNINELDFQFKSYYGGRTEVFKRGRIEDYNYYDVNSLYPYVMQKFEYPDPNSIRNTRNNTLDYIMEYEGVSEVTLTSPKTRYPLLPYRIDFKLLFPIGTWKATYTHIELREALKLGYKIHKTHRTIYFKKLCEPFKEFVRDLYKKRLNYKIYKSSMEYVTKITMNSLYGKFGQKFRDRDNWLPIPKSIEEFNKLDVFERIGMYVRIKKEISEPSAFCIPIWASYITGYARLHLHDLMVRSNAIYCDTDSIITKKRMITGSEIGKLKLENKISEGYIIKPKMYALRDYEGKEYVKIKGLGLRLKYHEFVDLLSCPEITYDKFTKFKEALRRGLTPNEIYVQKKCFSLEDTKRNWKNKLNINVLEDSQPKLLLEAIDDKISIQTQ